MAKKTDVEEVSLEKPEAIATDFGREDLNKLRDVVNFLLENA